MAADAADSPNRLSLTKTFLCIDELSFLKTKFIHRLLRNVVEQTISLNRLRVTAVTSSAAAAAVAAD